MHTGAGNTENQGQGTQHRRIVRGANGFARLGTVEKYLGFAGQLCHFRSTTPRAEDRVFRIHESYKAAAVSANFLDAVNFRIPSKIPNLFASPRPASEWILAPQHILKINLKIKMHSRTGLESAAGDPTTSLAMGAETAKNEE